MQPPVLASANRSWAEGAPQRAEGGALSTAASWLAANKEDPMGRVVRSALAPAE